MTKKPTATYKEFDIVIVPFPFTDRTSHKKRPALVISSWLHFNASVHQSILAMITSAKNSSWPLDTKITNLKETGLTSSSVIRLKIFTLNHRLILRKIGSLTSEDQKIFISNLKTAIPSL